MGWSPALGLIETRGLVGCIEAADAAAKTAEVEFLRLERVTGGLVCIHFVGETAAVQAATEAGAAAAARVGELISSHVIPRMDAETAAMLRRLGEPPEGDPAGRASPAGPAGYETLKLKELRTLARNTPDFPVKGRALLHISKERIIRELQRLQEEGDPGNA